MIIIVHARKLENLPPLISLMSVLRDIGESVVYLGVERTSEGERILKDLGVEYVYYPYPLVRFKEHKIRNIWQKLTKKFRPYFVRRWLWKKIKEFDAGADTLLWSAEMIGAAFLGDEALAYGKRHIQSLYELGDEMGCGLRGFDMVKNLQASTVIECEYNRAHIAMTEYGLNTLPFVVANKPYNHSRNRDVAVADSNVRGVVDAWIGKKVFLYQGVLQNDRGKLYNVIEILCKHFPSAVVAVMGRENDAVKKLARQYKNFSFISFIPPPGHLAVTSHAHVGLAYYQGGAVYGLSPLNAVYCAPNKIFEYSGYGIPILCNDIPGLRYSVGVSGAAEMFDDVTEASVVASAKKLLDSYDEYSDRATRFFDSVNIPDTVKRIVGFARS